MDRVCALCGAHFDGRIRNTCCPECRKKPEAASCEVVFAYANCIVCGKPFPLDGNRHKCCSNECTKKRQRQLVLQNKKANPEKHYAAYRAWYAKNKDSINAKRREQATLKQEAESEDSINAKRRKKDALKREFEDKKRKEALENKYKQFSLLWRKAISAESRDAFVSGCEWPSTADNPEAGAPEDRDRILGELWDVAHMSVREIRDFSGLSRQAFSDCFCIPKNTLANWERGRSPCPHYLRLLLAQVVGAYKRI